MIRLLAFPFLVVFTANTALAQARPSRPSGYLSPETTPDVARVVPPPPETGDARFNSDTSIYHSPRALEGLPRWTIAQADDNVSNAGLFKAFSCSLGATLTRESAPKTTALIARANADAGRATGLLKNLYDHKRPFLVEDAKVCVSPEGKAALAKITDYPSGHTIASWEAGLVLAELVPEKSTEILTRARAFGQSRVVCGVHNASAVEAGWMTATAIFAAQQASQEFRADVEAARGELKALLAQPNSAQSCSEEREALSKNPY